LSSGAGVEMKKRRPRIRRVPGQAVGDTPTWDRVPVTL
jgi:hypothetical protein